MSTQGKGTYVINSGWSSGSLVFYEKAVGRTATGDVLTIGASAVTVGGTSQDVDFGWYATGSKSFVLDAGAGTMVLAGVDVTITGDLTIDTEDIALGDNDSLEFGDAADVAITWDATNLAIIPATDNTGEIQFGNDGTKSMDVRFYGATASSYLLWDNSDDRLEFDGADLNLQDNDILQFGDAQDVAITWNGTNLTINPVADNTGVLLVGTDGTLGMDVKFSGATASAYMEWDNSADRLNIVTVSGRAITGEEHALDITNGGTCSSGDSMVGANVVTTASGVAASWVSAGFFKAVQAAKAVNGYICGLEVELQSTAENASDNAVLVLNSTRNHTGSPPAADPYILLREYGTTYGNVFLRVFGDTGQGAITGGADITTLCTGTADTVATCAVRCMFGSTVFWLLGTTTSPS